MKTPIRDNVEAMTMAIVMALLLKCFIVEAYKIPTGSMQPTLIGDEESGFQDRILVDKLSYTFGDPRRWDVAVFRYPLNQRQNFVKRIVGVGPEELRIESGDLWHLPEGETEWRVLRRPRAVQASVWKRLDVSDPPGESSWNVEAGAWKVDERTIHARGDGRASFRNGAITDRYFDGYPEKLVPFFAPPPRTLGRTGANPVGDVRVDGNVRALAGCTSFVIELREGMRRYTFTVPGPAAEAAASPTLRVETLGRWRTVRPDDELPEVIALGEWAGWKLPTDRAVRFAAQNMDDELQLELDGEIVATLEIPIAHDQSAAIHLDVHGEGADLDDLMAYRDIYYLAEGNSRVKIPAGHYFMLGDNTQDSSDSREWQFVRYAVPDHLAAPGPTWSLDALRAAAGLGALAERAGRDASRAADALADDALADDGPEEDGLAYDADAHDEAGDARLDLGGREADEPTVTVRGNSRGSENPRTIGFGAPGGPTVVLVDEFGETHWYPAREVDRLPPESAPFVPREAIQGRALAVFWPLDPLKDIYRWKWVR